MTAKEKKLFALGVGAGVLSAALIVGFLTAREMRSVSAASNASSPVAATRSDSGQVAEQGTEPGTTVELTPAEITAAGVHGRTQNRYRCIRQSRAARSAACLGKRAHWGPRG